MAARISDLRRSIEEDIPATEFVGGFPKEHVSILASAPGSGKTWFVLKHALDMSVGGSVFMGFATNQKPSKALIMCGEGGLKMLLERKREITTDYNPENIAIYTQTDLAEAEVEICLDSKDGCDNLRKIIAGEKADVCYLDSLIAFRDENENEQQSTSRIIKKLITIARATNCAIVATHHTRKRKRGDTGDATQDDIIGSSAITRLCAMAWTLNRGPDDTYTKLQCVKTWFKQPEAIYWRLVSRLDGTVRFDRATGGNISQQIARAVAMLNQELPGTTITIDALMEKAYVDATAAQGAMERAQQQGVGTITRSAEGDYVIIIE